MQVVIRSLVCMLFLVHSAFSTIQFVTISDIHYGSHNTSVDGKDVGDEFFTIAMNKLKELGQEVDFILTLGDLPTHRLGYTPETGEYEKKVFHGLYEADVKNKPMFYISGNNDPLSGNYQSFSSHGKSSLSEASDWTGACTHCEGLIIDDTHMYSGGYYSSYVLPDNKDVMLIVLNSTLFAKAPWLAFRYFRQDKEAMEQLDWFSQQLKNHKAKQLLIAMHIPPGKSPLGGDLWELSYLNVFLSALNQYHGLYGQVSLLTSHTHMDEIRKIDLKDGKKIYAFSTPAVSRIHHNNSGIKVFSLNSELQLQDYVTHYTQSETRWGGEHYQALGTADAIFPGCQNQTLAQCLDKLTNKQVCSYLNKGLFYGVKSPKVPTRFCKKVYQV